MDRKATVTSLVEDTLVKLELLDLTLDLIRRSVVRALVYKRVSRLAEDRKLDFLELVGQPRQVRKLAEDRRLDFPEPVDQPQQVRKRAAGRKLVDHKLALEAEAANWLVQHRSDLLSYTNLLVQLPVPAIPSTGRCIVHSL